MNDLITLADIINSHNVWVLIPLMGMAIPIVAIIAEGFRKAASARQYEESRREIAAYIAEGSMTPEDGENLLRARPDKKGKA